MTRNGLYWFWLKVRQMAEIVADAPLHDLGHAHASHMTMNGESPHTPGRLLASRRAFTANRYIHLDDATISQAVERAALAAETKIQKKSEFDNMAT